MIGVSHLSTAAALRALRREVADALNGAPVASDGRRGAAVVLELDAARARAVGIVPSITPTAAAVYPVADRTFPGVTALAWVLASTAVLTLYKDLVTGREYGREQVEAAAAAVGAGGDVVLGDRDLGVTLARLGRELSMRDLVSMIPSAVTGVVLPPRHHPDLRDIGRLLWVVGTHAPPPAVADAVRAIVRRAAAEDGGLLAATAAGRAFAEVNALLCDAVEAGALPAARVAHFSDAFARAMDGAAELAAEPGVMQAAIHTERDATLAAAIYNAPGDVVVATVGSGHLRGIAARWGRVTPEEVAPLLSPPPYHTAAAVGVPLAATFLTARFVWRLPRAGKLAAGAGVVAASAAVWHTANAVAALRDRVRAALRPGGSVG